ncbi:hypothetical protein TNCV_2464431 [Trichonephila clavipes]|nr:hypothetical protein TNCV_2464431 [Trichonephila clavipes]
MFHDRATQKRPVGRRLSISGLIVRMSLAVPLSTVQVTIRRSHLNLGGRPLTPWVWRIKLSNCRSLPNDQRDANRSINLNLLRTPST